ncbi:MAG: hypothetical protein HY718_21645 [Planctomycetes bacterium]|nr:hypothetical protein [Planctomycetota bacterium]
MTSYKVRRDWPGLVGLLLGASLASPALATVIVRFDPASSTRLPGDLFTVDVVADFGADSVIGWGIDVSYDAQVIALTSPPTIGPYWQPAFAPDGDGLTAAADPFSDPDQNGLYGSIGGDNVLLATLTFSAVQPGESPIVASITPGDLNEGFALDPIGFADVVYQPASVLVVPEPISICLILAGLLAMRRRR